MFLVLALGFRALLGLTAMTYIKAPPIPRKVVDETGTVLFTGTDISHGQEVFFQHGLMEHGTLWGHGAYLGPDYAPARPAGHGLVFPCRCRALPAPSADGRCGGALPGGAVGLLWLRSRPLLSLQPAAYLAPSTRHFWIATAWVGGGLFIAPIIGGREPRGYRGGAVAVLVALMFSIMGAVSIRTAKRIIYLDAILYMAGGIVGTAHHWYFTGQETSAMAFGACFSALEAVPLTLLTLDAWDFIRLQKTDCTVCGESIALK